MVSAGPGSLPADVESCRATIGDEPCAVSGLRWDRWCSSSSRQGRLRVFVPWWLTRWRIGPPFFGIEPLRWVGAALIVLGLLPLLSSFARFAWDGLGTPAP